MAVKSGQPWSISLRLYIACVPAITHGPSEQTLEWLGEKAGWNSQGISFFPTYNCSFLGSTCILQTSAWSTVTSQLTPAWEAHLFPYSFAPSFHTCFIYAYEHLTKPLATTGKSVNNNTSGHLSMRQSRQQMYNSVIFPLEGLSFTAVLQCHP